MTEATLATIPTGSIRVEDGHNPREHFDPDAHRELCADISAQGLLQSILVRPVPGEDGAYYIIDGERRWRAAGEVGLATMPALVAEDEDAATAALAANLMREDLNPIEVARALQAVGQSIGSGVHKKIAAKARKSPAFVSAHLRLLRLPEGVRRRVAAGTVPTAAERNLRRVAEVSPAVAEAACELVEREVIDGRDLIERFGEVLAQVAAADLPEPPTMIDAGRGESLGRIVTDPDRHAELAARHRDACPYEPGTDPLIRFTEAEVDAARGGMPGRVHRRPGRMARGVLGRLHHRRHPGRRPGGPGHRADGAGGRGARRGRGTTGRRDR